MVSNRSRRITPLRPRSALMAAAVVLCIAGTGCPIVKFNRVFGEVSATSLVATQEDSASAPLSVSGLSSASGSGNGGSVVVITGTGFLPGASASLGALACSSTTRLSSTQLQCVTPARAVGTVAATVRNPNGATASLASAYSYSAAVSWSGADAVAVGFANGLEGLSSSQQGGFSFPKSVAVDTTPGNQAYYVVDSTGYRVQKFDLATGAFVGAIGYVTSTRSGGTCPSSGVAPGWCTGGTFTSNATDGAFTYPEQIVLDPANDLFYVSDSQKHNIQKFVLSTGAFVGAIGKVISRTVISSCPSSGAASGWCAGGTFGSGSGDGMFSQPSGLALDATYLYVADYSNHRVVRVTRSSGAFAGAIGYASSNSGTCTAAPGVVGGWCTGGVFASNGTDGGFGSPNGLALDGTYLYVIEVNNHRVQRITLSSGASSGAIGYVSSSSGTCVAGGPASGWCTGGTFALGASVNGGFQAPMGALVDSSNGWLYVADTQHHAIQKFNLSTGAFIGALGSVTASSGTCPSSGYTAGFCTGGTFGSGSGDGAMTYPAALAMDSSYLYVVEWYGHRIQRFSLSGWAAAGSAGAQPSVTPGWRTASSGFARANGKGDGAMNQPSSIAVDPGRGYSYVVDTGNNRVARFRLDTGAFAGAIGKTTSSTGTCPSSGTASGWCMGGVFASGSSDGQFYNPKAVAVDPDAGYLYVADGNHRIQRISLDTGAFAGAIGSTTSSTGTCPGLGAAPGWCTGGIFTAGTQDGEFASPSGLALDSTYLYVTELTGYRVQRIELSSGAAAGAIGYVMVGAGACLAGGPSADWCLASVMMDAGPGVDGAFSNPVGVAVDAVHGHLYVSDLSLGNVQKFRLSDGHFLGAIGYVIWTAGDCDDSGTVINGWCSGGNFSLGSDDGQFYFPRSLAVDPLGDALYVADSSNNRLQKFSLSTGLFQGAVGGTSSSSGSCPASGFTAAWCTGGAFTSGFGDGYFYLPYGLAVDTLTGLIHVADSYNHRIQRLSL